MDTLDKLKDSALIIKTNKRIKSNTAVLVGEHLQTINKMFEELMMFVFVDKDGNETSDATKAIAIKPRSGKGFFSESFISAYGINSEGGGSGGGGGTNVSFSQTLTSGTEIGVITIEGIPYTIYAPTPSDTVTWESLSGKPSWIGDSKPAYTASEVGAISSVTSKMVTDALGFTPYNAANFTKANIKSTLGISDWALGASKPTYNLDEVEDGTTRKLSNYLLKSTFDELFEKVTANGVTYIRAKFGLASDDFISAYGVNSSGGSGGGGSVVSYTATQTNGTALGTLTIDGVNKTIYAPSLTGYATQSWVTSQGYLTSHQSLSGYATETWVGNNYVSNALAANNMIDNVAGVGILSVSGGKPLGESITSYGR